MSSVPSTRVVTRFAVVLLVPLAAGCALRTTGDVEARVLDAMKSERAAIRRSEKEKSLLEDGEELHRTFEWANRVQSKGGIPPGTLDESRVRLLTRNIVEGLDPRTIGEMAELAEAPVTASVTAEQMMAARPMLSDVLEVRRDLAKQAEAEAEEAALESKVAEDELSFMGTKFGFGPSWKFGGSREVSDAVLVKNGKGKDIVRATSSRRSDVAAMLELHTYLLTNEHKDRDGKAGLKWGMGPFVALELSDDDLMSGLGAGWMTGVRIKDNLGIAIGVGAMLDSHVRTLGSGLREGRPLPAGETQIRYRETSEWKGLVTFSFVWSF